MEKNNKRIINAWCMYDWANSVYSLVITSTIFPIYYNAVTKTNTQNGVDYVNFLGIRSTTQFYILILWHFHFWFCNCFPPTIRNREYYSTRNAFLAFLQHWALFPASGFTSSQERIWSMESSVL